MELEKIKGVGKVRAEKYAKLGITTAEELISYIPLRYENRGHILPLSIAADGEKHACILTVATASRAARISGGRHLIKFRAFDSSAFAEITFFCRNIRAVPKFSPGEVYRVYGRFTLYRGGIECVNPICEPLSEKSPLPVLYPVYKTTDGLSSKLISKSVQAALNAIENNCSLLEEYIPQEFIIKNDLLPLCKMYRLLHFPTTEDDIAIARKSICYREFFTFFSMTIAQRNERLALKKAPFNAEIPFDLIEKLPYKLTDGQMRAVKDIKRDLCSPFVMRRIVVGDVGCGKTAIAQFAAVMAIRAGFNVALMAPTEILAQQHYETLAPYFESLGYRTELLLGSTSAKEKRMIRQFLTSECDPSQKIRLIIGTHALLTANVCMSDLGLVIIDEQHRFGVIQRQKLIDKGELVNSLSLSATPIPRSYAKMIYGDTDSSIIAELPPGRTPPKTFIVNETYRERLDKFIEKKVLEGRQVYVVCPAIEPQEDDDEVDARKIKDLSAETRFHYLKNRFPGLSVDILHGKMRPAEKEAAMERFSSEKTQILVSTTVIEVGVNVPNATLMIIEGADRFGLSQLHQLRGRVARGTHESFCILVSDAKNAEAIERLKVLSEHSSGFDIAEADFKQRGPGDLFSMTKSGNIRQSGEFGFKYARFCDDETVMRQAYNDACAVMAADAAFDTEALMKKLAKYAESGLCE